jgi:hypothetical protein
MGAMKLHKILYYCQAWSLVWDDKPLFRERIEAWVTVPLSVASTQRIVVSSAFLRISLCDAEATRSAFVQDSGKPSMRWSSSTGTAMRSG